MDGIGNLPAGRQVTFGELVKLYTSEIKTSYQTFGTST
jgi:hypothetical protein